MRLQIIERHRADSPRNAHFDDGTIGIRVVPASCPPTVSVTGRVTVDSSPHLRTVLLQLLQKGQGSVLVVDMAEVSYLDMSGLATLLEALKTAMQRGKRLRVRGMTGQCRMFAEVVELDKIFGSAGSEVEYI